MMALSNLTLAQNLVASVYEMQWNTENFVVNKVARSDYEGN